MESDRLLLYLIREAARLSRGHSYCYEGDIPLLPSSSSSSSYPYTYAKDAADWKQGDRHRQERLLLYLG